MHSGWTFYPSRVHRARQEATAAPHRARSHRRAAPGEEPESECGGVDGQDPGPLRVSPRPSGPADALPPSLPFSLSLSLARGGPVATAAGAGRPVGAGRMAGGRRCVRGRALRCQVAMRHSRRGSGEKK